MDRIILGGIGIITIILLTGFFLYGMTIDADDDYDGYDKKGK